MRRGEILIMKKYFKFPRSIYSWLLVFILLISAFIRLYNIPGNVQFLGDQGRDALVVSKIFTEYDPVFIGPVMSVGNIYLGPFYYYFMLPFLWFSYPSPLGPVYAVAILGIITVGLMYYLGKDLIGEKAALIASGFYGLSYITAEHVRFSWNPNIIPFFSLVMIWATYNAYKKSPYYWMLVTTCFSILIQLHYMTLLSVGGAGLVLLYQIYTIYKGYREKHKKSLQLIKPLVLAALGSILIFMVFNTPIMLFDYKHDWLNSRAFVSMFVDDKAFASAEEVSLPRKLWLVARETHGRSMHILFEYTLGQHRKTNTYLVYFVVASFVYILAKSHKGFLHFGRNDNSKQPIGILIILVYLLVGIIGTSVYQNTIFDHHISFLFPITFLVYGIILQMLWKNKLGKVLVIAFTIYFLSYNIPRWPLQDRGWKVSDVQRTSQTIADKVESGEKYNIVLLSETGDIDGQSYRYFLSTTDNPPLPIERRGETETLFIINEDHKLDKVTDSPIYEIVVFPNHEVSETFNIENGPEISILRR